MINLNQKARKTAEYIKNELFNNGHNSVFVEMEKNGFFPRLEANYRSEHCYYIGNHNQTVEELTKELLDKMNQVVNKRQSYKSRYY